MRGLKLSSPFTLTLLKRRRLEGWINFPGQWFNQTCLCKNPKGYGLESFRVGEYVEIRKKCCAQRGQGSSGPFTCTGSSCLFHLAVPESYPFLINSSSSRQNVSLSSLSHSSNLIEPKEGFTRTSSLQPASHNTGDNLDLQPVSGVENSRDRLVGLSPSHGDLMQSPGRLGQNGAEL